MQGGGGGGRWKANLGLRFKVMYVLLLIMFLLCFYLFIFFVVSSRKLLFLS